MEEPGHRNARTVLDDERPALPRRRCVQPGLFGQLADDRAGDIDAAGNACADFDGYVNGKWYAANPIPGDRSSWGGFDALAERSLAVQEIPGLPRGAPVPDRAASEAYFAAPVPAAPSPQ